MKEVLGEAIQFFQGKGAVYFKYEDPDPEHPFGKGGGEFVLFANTSGRRSFRFQAPRSIKEVRRSISYIMRAMANHAGIVIVEDLHHLMRRSDPSSMEVSKYLIDMTMVYGFLGIVGEQVDTIHLARMQEQSVVEVALEHWKKLTKRAKRFQRKYHVDVTRAYASREVKPVKIYTKEGVPHNLYIQYAMNATKTGRLVAKGGKRGATLLFNPHVEPKKTRGSSLKADPGKVFIHADYVSAEPRTIAAMSGDKNLQKIFSRNADPYQIVVDRAGMADLGRSAGKTALLQSLYGSSVKSIAKELELHIEDARHLIRTVHELFPEALAFMDAIAQRAAEKGHVVTPTGRVLHCDDPENARRIMSNHFFQSLTADANIMTYAALIQRCNRVVPLIHIHDGYVLETYDQFAEEDAEFVREIMEENPLQDFGLNMNLRCSIQIADHWIG
jgi:hypothetical protein